MLSRIHHWDLYRIKKESELKTLKMEDTLKSGINLIEWSQNMFSYQPKNNYLEVVLQSVPYSKKNIDREEEVG